MNGDRPATALSIAVLLALAGWLAAQAMPRAALERQIAAPERASSDQPAPRARNRATRKARTVVLPAPPRVIAATAPPVQPLRPSGQKIIAAPNATPLTPIEAPAPKRTVPEPQAIKARSERKSEPRETPRAAPNRTALREGRALLRVLEHGAGPSIEIAWPETVIARIGLYRRFTECFGMQVVLMRGDGKLFAEAGTPGQPWAINLDRFSGFVRQPAGRLVTAERRQALRIRAHHPGLSGAAPIRVFPRRVDALLLAGLKRVVGQAYGKGGIIQARYRLTGGRVVVTDVRVDGRATPGRVDLSPAARSCGGGA